MAAQSVKMAIGKQAATLITLPLRQMLPVIIALLGSIEWQPLVAKQRFRPCYIC